MVGEEITRIIQDQRALESKYEGLIKERRMMSRGFANRAHAQENEEEVERVSLALRQSIKVLTRNLQDNPNLEGNMLRIRAERGSLESLLVSTAHELQYASFDSLEDVVDREQRRTEHVRVVLAREKELSDTVASLKRELAEERAAFEKEVVAKNERIAELKEALQLQRTETAIEMQYLGKQAKAQNRCLQGAYDKEIRDLRDAISYVENEKAIEERVNTVQMEFLDRKQAAMGIRADTINTMADRDQAERGRRLEAVKEARDLGLIRLHDLQESYDADVAGRAQVAEERRRLKELLAIKRAAEERDRRAAVLIQCNWKMRRARLALAEMKNPKKKKKGKGKGKGKGAAKKKK